MTSSDRKWSKGRRSRRECRRTPRTVGLLGFPPRVDDVYKPEVVFGRPEVVELSLYEVDRSTRAWSAAVPRECGHVRACTGVRRVRVDSGELSPLSDESLLFTYFEPPSSSTGSSWRRSEWLALEPGSCPDGVRPSSLFRNTVRFVKLSDHVRFRLLQCRGISMELSLRSGMVFRKSVSGPSRGSRVKIFTPVKGPFPKSDFD